MPNRTIGPCVECNDGIPKELHNTKLELCNTHVKQRLRNERRLVDPHTPTRRQRQTDIQLFGHYNRVITGLVGLGCDRQFIRSIKRQLRPWTCAITHLIEDASEDENDEYV